MYSRQPNGVFTLCSLILQHMQLVCLFVLHQTIPRSSYQNHHQHFPKFHKHIYNHRTRGIEDRQRAILYLKIWERAHDTVHETPHCASDKTDIKNEQDRWEEFSELRAGFTNSRRRLSHHIKARCLSSAQALRGRKADWPSPRRHRCRWRSKRGPSPGASYPPSRHQSLTVSFIKHQLWRCRLTRSGVGWNSRRTVVVY